MLTRMKCLTRTESDRTDDYDTRYREIRFDSIDDLPLEKH